jgi:hypothetical protein
MNPFLGTLDGISIVQGPERSGKKRGWVLHCAWDVGAGHGQDQGPARRAGLALPCTGVLWPAIS